MLGRVRWLVESEVDVYRFGRARRFDDGTVVVVVLSRLDDVEADGSGAGGFPYGPTSLTTVAPQRALLRGEQVLSNFATQGVKVGVAVFVLTARLAACSVDAVVWRRVRAGRSARWIEERLACLREVI